MRLLERIANKKTGSEKAIDVGIDSDFAERLDSPGRPALCTCEKPSPRWRKIDGQIFCLICTPPPELYLIDAILHVPSDGQNANRQSGSTIAVSDSQADDLPPYAPLERSVPWSHPSIVRSIYEGYGLLPKTEPLSDDEIRDENRDGLAARSQKASGIFGSPDDSAIEWHAELASWALSLRPEQLPPEPWRPNAWTEVRSNAALLAALQFDVRLGRSGPKARTGALQRQLRELHILIANAD